MATVTIGSTNLGEQYPTYFIADIAANHDGDLERAKALIHMAAEAGADAAKFQNFKAERIVSDFGFKNMQGQMSHQKKWGKSVFEVYKDASIPDDWTLELYQECRKAGINYSTSPYDFGSVDAVAQWVDFYKIGSGDITWLDMCSYIAQKNKPVFLATGASEMGEVELAMDTIQKVTSQVVLMQCNTNYTGSDDNFQYINLRVLETFARRWPNIVLGLSDHTPGHATVLGAVALGARVIEKHFTDDKSRVGPDHAFSLTPQEWQTMVDRTRELEAALGNGIKEVEKNELETVVLQRRCIRVTRDMKSGEVLQHDDLEVLRPAPKDSLKPQELLGVVGRSLIRDIKQGQHLTLHDMV